MCAGCEFREGGGGVRTEASGGGCRGSAAVLPAAAAGLVGDGLHLGARLHRAGQLDLPHPLRVAVCRQRRPESALRYAARETVGGVGGGRVTIIAAVAAATAVAA